MATVPGFRRALRAVAFGAVLWPAVFAAGCRERPSDAAAGPLAAPPSVEGHELVFEQIVDGNQDIYAIPAGGGVERRLTDDPALDGLPRYTPDGKSVVFSSERGGHYQLWQVARKGGAARPV